MSGANDPRIVFGVLCTWWDSISEAATVDDVPGGMPCCPHCGSVLMQVDDQFLWDAGVARWDLVEPGFKAHTEWGRGKCFPSYHERAKAYAEATR